MRLYRHISIKNFCTGISHSRKQISKTEWSLTSVFFYIFRSEVTLLSAHDILRQRISDGHLFGNALSLMPFHQFSHGQVKLIPENHQKIGLQSPEKYWLIYMYLPHSHKNFTQDLVMIYLLKHVKIWMRNHLLESQMSKLLQAPWPIIYFLISWILILPNQSLNWNINQAEWKIHK